MKIKRIYFKDKLCENHEKHTFFKKRIQNCFSFMNCSYQYLETIIPFCCIIKLCCFEAHSILLYCTHNHICQDPIHHSYLSSTHHHPAITFVEILALNLVSLFITISAITLGDLKSHMNNSSPNVASQFLQIFIINNFQLL